MQSSVQDPASTWPSRHGQRDQLLRALRVPRRCPIFLWGGSATGKRSVLFSALRTTAPAARVTYIDCVCSHSDRALFNAISEDTTSPDALVRAVDRQLNACGQFVVVLFRAERLAEPPFGKDTLRLLLTLPFLVASANFFRIVFVSRLPWIRFRDTVVPDVRDPICIHFAAYSENEAVAAILEMTSSSLPPKLPSPGLLEAQEAFTLYPGFVTSVVNVLYKSTTDLRELARACSRLYPAYLQPLVEDPSIQRAALWNRVSVDVTNAVQMLYRREFKFPNQHQNSVPDVTLRASAPLRESYVVAVVDSITSTPQRGLEWRSTLKSSDHTVETELCLVARLLLVAAFLASHNPPTTDLHYFSTQVVRRRTAARKASNSAAKRKNSRKPRGLSETPVPLNRILAIFDAIQCVGVEADVSGKSDVAQARISMNVFINLSILVDLKLLKREGFGDPLRDPKFCCNISVETATDLAKSVGIPLREYLHEDIYHE